MEPVFLTVEQVLDLHKSVIDLWGGSHGLRDAGLLESAVMAPQQTFGGELLYKSLVEIGVAYWMGLVLNHPFIDGNKRIGLLAFDTFMLMNNVTVDLTENEAVKITLTIATGEMAREELVYLIERRSPSK